MITPAYAQTMARYNAWQNRGLLTAFESLSDEALRAGRGAYFGSLLSTASHLLWGDCIWMSRFAGWPKPEGGIAASVDLYPTRGAWAAARAETDAGIVAWADALSQDDLEGDLSWFSGAAGRDVTERKAICVMHFFNHQTHHRGQIHAMLTDAGWETEDSDLFLLPKGDT
ncbi:MAG: DinB family protein [Shimia sp.]